jgi:hypothetical protein
LNGKLQKMARHCQDECHCHGQPDEAKKENEKNKEEERHEKLHTPQGRLCRVANPLAGKSAKPPARKTCGEVFQQKIGLARIAGWRFYRTPGAHDLAGRVLFQDWADNV